MLELKNISKTYEPGTPYEKKIITDLSLNVNDGDFISIIGANGTGKTTLFNLIAGTILADDGSIILDGEDITMETEHKRAKYIGRIFQDPLMGNAPGMTIEENLFIAAGNRGWLSHISRAEKADFRDRIAQLDMGLENRMHQRMRSLSGGQRQAVTLIMATYHAPKILLLDEHTAALDPAAAEKVMAITKKIVEENHITCLMITHNMQMALDLGNRTIMMNGGNILFDVQGEERSNMTVQDLLNRFRQESGTTLTSDRMLLG